jgi:hypothetical protein
MKLSDQDHAAIDRFHGQFIPPCRYNRPAGASITRHVAICCSKRIAAAGSSAICRKTIFSLSTSSARSDRAGGGNRWLHLSAAIGQKIARRGEKVSAFYIEH